MEIQGNILFQKEIRDEDKMKLFLHRVYMYTDKGVRYTNLILLMD